MAHLAHYIPGETLYWFVMEKIYFTEGSGDGGELRRRGVDGGVWRQRGAERE